MKASASQAFVYFTEMAAVLSRTATYTDGRQQNPPGAFTDSEEKMFSSGTLEESLDFLKLLKSFATQTSLTHAWFYIAQIYRNRQVR